MEWETKTHKAIEKELRLIQTINDQAKRIKELEAEVFELKHPWTKTSVTLEPHPLDSEEGEG